MKTSRLLLAAIPMGALAVGAVALGKWSFRNIFSSNGASQASAAKKTDADDRATPIPGSAEEVASVADAMAQEGGPVLLTEVADLGDDEVIVAETLLVPDTAERATGAHKA